MNTLTDDLSGLASAIVCGDELSPQIAMRYPAYSSTVGIEAYRNNYRGNLHDALAGAYPVIEQLVGRDFFRLLTRQFIGQYPSRSGNLHLYGAQMAEFIAAFAPAQGLVYLADVAALEWACHCAYFADDAAALDLVKLGQVPADQHADLILQFHPACHLLRSRYPVAAIWLAHRAPGDDFYIDLNNGPCNALVTRKDDVVQVCDLAHAEAAWLQHLLAGSPLGQATAATLAYHAEFDLQSALLHLVALGVLSGFSLKEAS